MKSLHQLELEKWIEWLRPRIIGSQLQEVYAHDQGIVLGLYRQHSFWLILDLIPAAPFLAWIDSEKSPWPKTKLTKPVGLFLNSHGKNLFLESIVVDSEQGRVVRMLFQNKTQICEIEMQLVPKRPNVKVMAQGKSISWQAWKELKHQPDSAGELRDEPRSPEALLQEWLQNQKLSRSRPMAKSSGIEILRKDLQKKLKATGAIQETILKNQADSEILYRLGEDLKQKTLESFQGTENEPFLNFKRSASWNREHCFSLAKSYLKKNQGAELRLVNLRKDVSQLEEKIKKVENGEMVFEPSAQSGPLVGKHKISRGGTDVKARKKVLASGLVVYMGKSAKDNLSLLRRARAWDYWLHLRDYPGAHAIVHREKNQNFSSTEMKEVARWLAEESLSAKTLQSGLRLDVILAEVRFVRPIKGDTAGKVNYHSEKVFHFTYEKSEGLG